MKSIGTLIVVAAMASGSAAKAGDSRHGGRHRRHRGHHSSHFSLHSLFHGSHHGHRDYGHHGLHFGLSFGSLRYYSRSRSPCYYVAPTYRRTVRYIVPPVQTPAFVSPRVQPTPPVVPPIEPDNREPILVPEAVPTPETESSRRFVPRPVSPTDYSARHAVTTSTTNASLTRTRVAVDDGLGPQLTRSARPSLEDRSVPWIVADDDAPVGSNVAKFTGRRERPVLVPRHDPKKIDGPR